MRHDLRIARRYHHAPQLPNASPPRFVRDSVSCRGPRRPSGARPSTVHRRLALKATTDRRETRRSPRDTTRARKNVGEQNVARGDRKRRRGTCHRRRDDILVVPIKDAAPVARPDRLGATARGYLRARSRNPGMVALPTLIGPGFRGDEGNPFAIGRDTHLRLDERCGRDWLRRSQSPTICRYMISAPSVSS